MPHSVAIVEDDSRLRAEYVRAVRDAADLRLAGEAGDLPEGLALLRTGQPDVLLVDLELPSGSGIELIRYAASALPRCEVMVVTLFADERQVLACLEAGACGYLLKDVRAADMAEQIRTLCAGGSPISPTIARRLLTRFRPAAAAGSTPLEPTLSAQEHSVLTLCAKGYNYAEIARMLVLSSHTVRTYVKRIYRKLQVHGKTEAVYEARKLRLLDD